MKKFRNGNGWRFSRRFAKVLAVRLAVMAGVLLAVVVQAPAQDKEPGTSLRETASRLFKPLPPDMSTREFPIVPARVALGKQLFFDPRLSLDGTVSCAVCHRPALYGTDALPKSFGVEHRLNARNAPTVLNAALQFKAHWLGDRANVEEQAMKSLIGPASFGNLDQAMVMAKLKALGYANEFARAFPADKEPVSPGNLGLAIGAYERTLISPAPFDAYLKGDAEALSVEAKEGLRTFIAIGCASCHNGMGIGGSEFQKFGIFSDYWLETGSQPIDEGRFALTKLPADKYLFKTPSLRNVAMTPPYFHDGSVAELPKAVRIMAKLQLSRELNEQEVVNLTAFMNSLTGDMPDNFAAEPVLAPNAFKGSSGP